MISIQSLNILWAWNPGKKQQVHRERISVWEKMKTENKQGYFLFSSRHYNMEEERSSWESKHKFYRMKKEEKGEKKLEKNISLQRFQKKWKDKEQQWERWQNFVRKNRTINISRSRAIHRHKDERNPMENLCQLQLPEVTWEPSQSCSNPLTSPVLLHSTAPQGSAVPGFALT